MYQSDKSNKLEINPPFDFSNFDKGEPGTGTNKEWTQTATGNVSPYEVGNKKAFPIDVFPQQVQDILNATNRTLNFPIDFTGTAMLYAISVAIGNTHKIEVKRTWEETAVLYLAIVGNAGTNKSHPLSFALKPIEQRDSLSYEVFQTKNKEYNDSIKSGSLEVDKPIWEQRLVNDFTPESLIDVHKFNKRGVGVYVDELVGWINNFDRYKKGSDEQFWLSTWSGKPITVNRKSSDPISIASPFISVIGTIQPGVLIDLAKGKTDNGFMDRILFAYPDNLKKEYWSNEELDPKHKNNWNSIISKLLDIPLNHDQTGSISPNILKFDPGAKELLFDWQARTTDKSNSSKDGVTKSIIPKIESYTIRLSLILEMMRYSCGESDGHVIRSQSVQGAIRLANYFMEMAFKLHDTISNDDPLNKLPRTKQTVYNALPNPFTTGEGIKIASENGMKQRTFETFIRDADFFIKVKTGEYEKIL